MGVNRRPGLAIKRACEYRKPPSDRSILAFLSAMGILRQLTGNLSELQELCTRHVSFNHVLPSECARRFGGKTRRIATCASNPSTPQTAGPAKASLTPHCGSPCTWLIRRLRDKRQKESRDSKTGIREALCNVDRSALPANGVGTRSDSGTADMRAGVLCLLLSVVGRTSVQHPNACLNRTIVESHEGIHSLFASPLQTSVGTPTWGG